MLVKSRLKDAEWRVNLTKVQKVLFRSRASHYVEAETAPFASDAKLNGRPMKVTERDAVMCPVLSLVLF